MKGGCKECEKEDGDYFACACDHLCGNGKVCQWSMLAAIRNPRNAKGIPIYGPGQTGKPLNRGPDIPMRDVKAGDQDRRDDLEPRPALGLAQQGMEPEGTEDLAYHGGASEQSAPKQPVATVGPAVQETRAEPSDSNLGKLSLRPPSPMTITFDSTAQRKHAPKKEKEDPELPSSANRIMADFLKNRGNPYPPFPPGVKIGPDVWDRVSPMPVLSYPPSEEEAKGHKRLSRDIQR